MPGTILSGHTDVVPVDRQSWSTDPFRLTERNGCLYGRPSGPVVGTNAGAGRCPAVQHPSDARAVVHDPRHVPCIFLIRTP
jgi:Peptidase family M20/M25/M40